MKPTQVEEHGGTSVPAGASNRFRKWAALGCIAISLAACGGDDEDTDGAESGGTGGTAGSTGGSAGSMAGQGGSAEGGSAGDAGIQVGTEITGTWHSASSGGPGSHSLIIGTDSMQEKSDDGDLDVRFSLDEYDNDLDRARATVTEVVTGTPPYSAGTVFYMSYILSDNDMSMKLYFSTSAYPTATGGIEGEDYVNYTKTE